MLFTEGDHILEAIGGENCCDGASTWRFSLNGGDWYKVSTETLDLLADAEAFEGMSLAPFVGTGVLYKSVFGNQ